MKDEKEALRAAMREKLAAFSPEERARASEKILASLRWEIPLAGAVLLYFPLPDEPDLSSLCRELAAAGRLAIPSMEGAPLRVVSEKDLGTLRKVGKLRVAPAEAPAASFEAISLAVIPALAFDAEGIRLGRGGGYFDKILDLIESPTIGVAFACQVVEKLPRADHDRGVGRVLTEKGWMETAAE